MSKTSTDRFGNARIQCRECSEWLHDLSLNHLSQAHKMRTVEYRLKHPGAPIRSTEGARRVQEARSRARRASGASVESEQPVNATPEEREEQERRSIPQGTGTVAVGIARLAPRNPSAEDEVYVPALETNFSPSEPVLEALALAVEGGDNVLFVGPTGCGKTSTARHLAAMMNQPVVRVNFNGDFRAADLIGEKVIEVDPATGQSVVCWRDGVLPKAMEEGYWLIADELDAAPPAVLFVLQSVLEEGGVLTLAGDGGRVVRRHPNFRFIATANTLGRGDDTGLYTGTHVLNEAFLDRFGTVLEVTYLAAAQEAEVLVRRTRIDASTAKQMVEVATMVRKAAASEECSCTFSTRRLLRWAERTVRMGKGRAAQAAQVTVLNKLTRDDRALVGAIVQRVMGGA